MLGTTTKNENLLQETLEKLFWAAAMPLKNNLSAASPVSH